MYEEWESNREQQTLSWALLVYFLLLYKAGQRVSSCRACPTALVRLFLYCLLRTAGSRTVRLGYLLLSRRAQGGISISGVAWLMLIRIPLAIVVHGRNLFGICSRGRCLQSRPHYLQHFPEAANRKFMQKNYTQRTTPGEEDAIGNGLETVCGAGQMRRDAKWKIVYVMLDSIQLSLALA